MIRKRMRLGKDSTQPPINLKTLFARTRLDCNPRAMVGAHALEIIGAERGRSRSKARDAGP